MALWRRWIHARRRDVLPERIHPEWIDGHDLARPNQTATDGPQSSAPRSPNLKAKLASS